MVEYATVQLHAQTKARLAQLRQPGESFDAAVQRLLDTVVSAQETEFLAELDRMYEDDAFEPLA